MFFGYDVGEKMKLLEFLKVIKNKYTFIWFFIERINGLFCKIFKKESMVNIENRIINFWGNENTIAKKATSSDISDIVSFFEELSSEDTQYFQPFEFTKKSLLHVLSCGTYQLYLVIFDNQIAGIFFLRFFINNKCFLGYAVKKEFRGKGLGQGMLAAIIYGISRSKFRLMSTICTNNTASLKAHMATGRFEIIETLQTNEVVLRMKTQNEK